MKTETILSGLLSALILLASPAAMADRGHLKRCINQATKGGDTGDQLQIMKHTFYCKKLARKSVGVRSIAFKGVLVHEKFGFDDKVNYSFVVRDGKLIPKSLKSEIDPGWGTDKILEGLRVLLKEVPLPVPDAVTNEVVDRAIDEADKKLVGNWEAAAGEILNLIAAKQTVLLRAPTVATN
jgi:hypothetical protein